MNHRRHWLLCFLAALSLLICGGTVLAWGWSYSATRALGYETSSGSFTLGVGCSQGELFIERQYSNLAVAPHSPGFVGSLQRPARSLNSLLRGPMQTRVRFGGFAVANYAYFSAPLQSGRSDVFWPCWVQVLLTSILPVQWLFRRRQPALPGHCLRCSYDLRATPDRCPECGTLVTKLRHAISSCGRILAPLA
jgi:hypothetical protein